jgi:hypothetical protein
MQFCPQISERIALGSKGVKETQVYEDRVNGYITSLKRLSPLDHPTARNILVKSQWRFLPFLCEVSCHKDGLIRQALRIEVVNKAMTHLLLCATIDAITV